MFVLFVGVVCMDNYLYAVGGFDGQTQLKTMERYNVTRDVWEPMASMKHCRSAHAVTVYQCKIYVLGELDAWTDTMHTLKAMEDESVC